MPDSLDRIIDLTFELRRTCRQKMSCGPKETEGVNFAQVHALLLIEKQPGMTMKELAKALHITSPSATSFVSRLEKSHWVERYHDPLNRRLVRLRMSPTGKKLLHVKMSKRRNELKDILRLLPAKDQIALARILKHLLASLPASFSHP